MKIVVLFFLESHAKRFFFSLLQSQHRWRRQSAIDFFSS